jgi:hypothetical protein
MSFGVDPIIDVAKKTRITINSPNQLKKMSFASKSLESLDETDENEAEDADDCDSRQAQRNTHMLPV